MRYLLALLLFASHAPALLAQSPALGDPAIQTVQLEEGWNWVALSVLPDNGAIPSVLGSALPGVVLLKNDAGEHFSPRFGVYDLEDWKWNEAYAVRADESATVYLAGQRILAEGSPLNLRAGWNMVPFLPSVDLAVEEALATIADHIEVVRDVAGQTYEPGRSGSSLDTLRAGQGYMVRVSQATSLLFPETTPPGGDGSLVAPTIAAALALPGLEVGQLIQVLGYHSPGDGGGGLFLVEDSGAEIDNGFVFVPAAHVSGEQQINIGRTGDPVHLPHQNVVPGTVSVGVFNSSGSHLVEVDGKHLHGHSWIEAATQRPAFRYGPGIFEEHRWRLWALAGDGGTFRIRYRHATSTLRLVRQDSRDVLNVRHFGARSYDEDPSYDVHPLLGHVLNRAQVYDSHTVLFPDTKVYEYYGALNMPHGITFAGVAGTELVNATDEFGNQFQPVRVRAQHTRLRVKAGEALMHMRMDLQPGHPGHVPLDAKYALGHRKTAFSVAAHAAETTIRDIILDGNWEDNQEAFQNQDLYGGFQALETNLRNTPGWAGYVSTNHNGVPIPPGQTINMQNVAVLGYASNGILGNINNIWVAENLLLGNSLWNHVLYFAGGYYQNLTLTGFAWSHVAASWGEVNNLVYEDLAVGPYRHASPFQIRLPDASTSGEAVANGWQRSDGTPVPALFHVDGFYFDGRGSDENTIAGGIGPNVRFKNGIVVRSAGHGGIYTESGNGYQQALYADHRFENITLIDDHAILGQVFGQLNITDSVFRGITVEPMPGTSAGQGDSFFLSFRTMPRNHSSWNGRRKIYVDDVHDLTEKRFIMQVSGDELSAPIDIFIKNSSFNNRSNGLFVRGNNQGQISGFPNGTDFGNFRVFLKDTDINFGLEGNQWHNKELFLATAYMQNVTAANRNLSSEDSGTVSFTASGGETTRDIPTSLFWVPEHTEFSGSSSGLIASYQYVYPDTPHLSSYRSEPTLRVTFNQALSSGQSVNFQWSASVRPFPAGFDFPAFPE